MYGTFHHYLENQVKNAGPLDLVLMLYSRALSCLRISKKAIEEGAPGGGFIFGSSNAIQSSVPPENFLIMLETAKKYGKYKSEV